RARGGAARARARPSGQGGGTGARRRPYRAWSRRPRSHDAGVRRGLSFRPLEPCAAMKIEQLIKRLRIDDPEHFKLAAFECSDTCGLDFDKHDGEALLAADIARLTALQEQLWAQGQCALLVVLQGMDASGKDGVIKHVMSGINPQGCEVHSFKAPGPEDLDHAFLRRAAKRLPARGRIGIFTRSYYEEVLVVRVHPELLQRQKLPPRLLGKSVWKHRYKDIRAFERHLVRNGVRVLKFF